MADSAFTIQTTHDDSKIDKTAITQGMPMPNDPTMVPSSADSLLANTTVLATALANDGKIQTAAGIEYGAWAYPFTGTTNSSGIARIYLTSNGLVGGTVAFPNKVFNASAAPIGVGAANYNVTAISVAADRSYIDVTLNQIKSVLGLLSYNATADAGVTVQGTIWGR